MQQECLHSVLPWQGPFFLAFGVVRHISEWSEALRTIPIYGKIKRAAQISYQYKGERNLQQFNVWRKYFYVEHFLKKSVQKNIEMWF